MNEQKVGCEAIVEAIKKDANKKGSRAKKIDHWKPYACRAVGVSKMGSARWLMIVNYGLKEGYFKIEGVNGKETLSLNSEEDPSQAPIFGAEVETPEVPEKEVRDKRGFMPSDYIKGTGILKVDTPRARSIKTNAHRSDLIPQKGDLLWAIRPDNSIFHSEVEEVSIGVHVTPLNKKDGHWTYASSNDVYEDQKEAKKEADRRKAEREAGSAKNFWDAEVMNRSEYALFKEYLDNRDAFFAYLKKFSEDTGLEEDLLS